MVLGENAILRYHYCKWVGGSTRNELNLPLLLLRFNSQCLHELPDELGHSLSGSNRSIPRG
jgi:hypothetical protein